MIEYLLVINYLSVGYTLLVKILLDNNLFTDMLLNSKFDIKTNFSEKLFISLKKIKKLKSIIY